ncbi:putative ATP-dependent RNA helicase ECM32 [Candida viswanathii]|uniref:Putative ATP-dependent RNA helicase ECM32 n=1 Tax=Candida viswanathii TaxID=5486 RepID=A0A367Y187_9ASCO|nr:putative ATP-dependent RNA helicase ECM32 [Candida viswanathii]
MASETYTCLTCSEKFTESLQIQKHLSSTRHKSVRLENLDETLECEECSDNNIHQLTIVRYGFSDMSLLCQSCLDKDNQKTGESPSASYSLSNGAFFGKLPQYLKFRDIECMDCGEDSRLYVANPSEGQLIICRKCLPKYESDKVKFISEDSDTFLSELLGIKEVIFKKSSRKRKVGKKGGKGGKMGRRPRKVDPEAEARREHYLKTKKTASDLKSGTTVKAIGSTRATPSSKSGPGNGKPTGKFNPKAKTPQGSGKSTPMGGKSPFGSEKSTPKVGKSPAISRSQTPLIPNMSGKPPAKSQSNPKNNGSKQNAPAKGKTTEDKKDAGSKAPAEKKDGSKKKDGKSKPDTKKTVANGAKSPPSKTEGRQKPPKSDKPKAAPKQNAKDTKQSKADKKSDDKKSKSSTPVPSETSGDLVLPSYITKFHPSPKPKLTYDSLNEYFKEISFNVFLEDQLTNELNILDSSNFTISWYEDQDKKNNQYQLHIPMDPDVTDKFVSHKLKKFKKNPFLVDQTIFLILNDEIMWSGYIATADEVASKKGRRVKKDVIELIIVLHPWTQPLPRTVHVSNLKILPASQPVSRVLNAMKTLNNASFTKMILGKEPIRQIDFRNFIKFQGQSLNDSQKKGVQSVLNNSITVLQGPPGTGKTSTIYEIILQLLNSLNTYPILVVAASNIAIDNIAEKLMTNHEKDILRITAGEKERDYNRSHPLASICLHHKIYDAMPMRYQQVMDEMKRGMAPTIGATSYKKFAQERFFLSNQIVTQAKVVLATPVVAGGIKSLNNVRVVIIDEATQSSEPTTLIPLALPSVEKLVLVGDQKQLSCFSLIPNLSLSLFERVLLNGTYKTPHMLDTQYRMHPDISEFSRNRFYGGLLKDGIDASARHIEGVTSSPLYFWDTKGNAREQSVRNFLREDRGYTYTNRDEIAYIKQVIRTLIITKGVRRDQIGIVTPYSGQRDLISSMLVKDDVINPSNEQMKTEVDIDDLKNDSKPVTIHIVSGIMIASIDAFQGREKDFMIMSCVRSNTNGVIGFLRDERRLNVALTRAKYALIMIGDVECLKRGDKLWKDYLEYLESKKAIHDDDVFVY